MHETLFLICNIAVVPAWLLLVIAPKHRVTQVTVHSGAASALFCVVYTALMGVDLLGSTQAGGFSTLEQLSVLFSRPEAALIGWVHYLALDLLIGSWELKDMERHGLSLSWRFLTLPLTLLLAPFGLLVYLGVRAAFSRGPETTL